MENFVFMGVFVGLGFLFRHLKAFPVQTAQALNMIALYLALPAIILLKAPQLSLTKEMMVPVFIAWTMLIFSALLVYLLGKRFKWSRETIAVLMLVVPIGNTSFMGVPMVNAFFGEQGLPFLIVYDQFGTMLIFAGFGSVILALHESEGTVNPMRIIRQAVTFPPTIALAVGLSLRFWPYPEMVVRLLEKMGSMMTPLVMTAIGFQLQIRMNPKNLQPLCFGLAIKLMVAPLAALLLCSLLGLQSLGVDVSIFEAGMPPMVTAGALAIAAGIAPELAAALVSLGMALSFATLPLLYWIC